MARKNYPDEFKGDAVALYRDTDGATITVIAAELGVSEATLSVWCKAAGVAIRHRKSAGVAQLAPGVETPEQKLARLRAENKALRAEQTKLATERDILRSAAKYFAGETNWASRLRWICRSAVRATSSSVALRGRVLSRSVSTKGPFGSTLISQHQAWAPSPPNHSGDTDNTPGINHLGETLHPRPRVTNFQGEGASTQVDREGSCTGPQ